MTVKDLKKAYNYDDCVCVCDIATDTCLYDSYLCDSSTYDNIDDDVLDMTVSEFGTGDQSGLVIDVDTCIV